MTLPIEFIREHIESNPDSATFPYYADLLLNAGDTGEAYRVCSEGLEIYPEFATGWYIFGKIARERNEQEFAKTCWFKALTLDSMALNAAREVLSLEDVTLSFEETETAANALLEIDKNHELARQMLDALEPRSVANEPGEDEVEDQEAPEKSDETDESGLEFDFDEVEEEPEEFEEETKHDLPSEQADHDVLQSAFEAAYKDRPEFQAPEFDAEISEEDLPEVADDFTPPSFQPKVLDENQASDELPETEAPDSDKESSESIESPAEDVEEDDPDEIPVAESSKAPTDFMAEKSSIKITARMATFTFAGVLKSQGLHEQAYQVLELMRKKSDDIERIEKEQAELEDLINQHRNQERSAD